MFVKISCLLLLLFFAFWAKAQQYSTQNKAAIRYYEQALAELNSQVKIYPKRNEIRKQNRYDEAMELLEKAIKKDPKFTEAHLALAKNYEIFQKYQDKMIYHYEQAIKSSPNSRKVLEAYLIVAKDKLNSGKYKEAKQYAEKFLTFEETGENNTQEARRIVASADFAQEKIANPLPFSPKPVSPKINRKEYVQDFPVLTADQNAMFFTAVPKKEIKYQTGEDIFVSFKKDNEWGEPMPLSINTQANEGTCTISADGKILVFTSCQGRKSFGNCDLYISERIGNEWSEPANMGENINSPYWDSQPSLSADGRTLYFVSNRGKKNNHDIFVSYRNSQGDWTPAQPLPPPINTPKDEFSPFIHANGKTLFFASDGHIGMGGLDLYSSDFENNQWTSPKNLGYPINNHLDQISIFVTADGKKGYYGDRKVKNNIEEAVIMEFEMPEAITVQIKTQYLKGRVLDAKTKEALEAEIELINLSNNRIENAVKSDKVSGEYFLVLNEQTEYALEVRKKGYAFKSMRFDFSDKKADDLKPIEMDILLDPIAKGATFVLNNIFFDTGKWELREKSKTELNELIRFMQDNPQVRGEISGHTDNVGEKKANQELSIKRAKSVYDYLVQNGIEPQRLTYKGYGDTQPAAPNDSEENKQRNRRIEFKIL
jgi:outer membrane protein OmpA-like peptidoglycan-associated protein